MLFPFLYYYYSLSKNKYGVMNERVTQSFKNSSFINHCQEFDAVIYDDKYGSLKKMPSLPVRVEIRS